MIDNILMFCCVSAFFGGVILRGYNSACLTKRKGAELVCRAAENGIRPCI